MRAKTVDVGNEIFTHVVSVAEIISKESRKGKDAGAAWSAIVTNSKIFLMDEADSKEVGLLHARIESKDTGFGLADAFVLAAARKLDGKVLTGSPEFRGIDDVVMLS